MRGDVRTVIAPSKLTVMASDAAVTFRWAQYMFPAIIGELAYMVLWLFVDVQY